MNHMPRPGEGGDCCRLLQVYRRTMAVLESLASRILPPECRDQTFQILSSPGQRNEVGIAETHLKHSHLLEEWSRKQQALGSLCH